MKFIVTSLFVFIILQSVSAFGLHNVHKSFTNDIKGHLSKNRLKLPAVLITASILSFGFMDKAIAAETKTPVLTYKSGKSPTGVNQNDPKKGTKKEPSFLKCVSNCKSDCQKPGEGLAKNDCVSDCQDQCCSSYEQCSFKIKSSSGNSI